jgi:hypothetical protein
MDLDILKEKWAEQDRKIDSCIRLNRQILMAVNMNRLQWPLRRFTLFTGLGVLLGLITLAILGSFIYTHWAEPRFALPAVGLHAWVIGYVAASIRQMVMALQIDYNKPIALIQKQIESLRVLRLRSIRWALLTGQLVWWIPFVIVALKGLWGVDAYRVLSIRFLIVNVAVGVALIPAAIWMSKKFGDRMEHSPAMQRFMRDLAGYNISAASDFLATLSEFEDETGSRGWDADLRG